MDFDRGSTMAPATPSLFSSFKIDYDVNSEQAVRKTTQRLWPFSLVVAIVLLPFVVIAALTVVQISENDIKQWLPKGFEEAEKHDWFTQHFGVDEMIVASWPGCTEDDPRLQTFADRLRDQKMSDGSAIYDRILTGNQILTQIEEVGVNRSKAKDRVSGLFIGPDREQTCLLAFPTQRWAKDRSSVVENFYRTAESSIDVVAEDLKLGGPTVDGAAIDAESKKSLRQFIGLTVLTVFVLCWIRMRNLKLSLVVLGFSVYSAMLALAILYWTGGKMNLTMIMLPTLIFILTVSACVHLANYFHKAAVRGPIEKAAIEAVRGGGYPVALSAITTAVGMISLATSKIWPIKLFGIYSAAGLVASLPIVLIVLPATLHFLGPKFAFVNRPEPAKENKDGVSRHNSILVNWICRSHWMVTVPCGIGLVFLAIGSNRLEASVKIQDRFADRTKIIQDYLWLENNLGPLVPMEVIVRFDETNELSNWDRMRLVAHVEKGLKEHETINAAMSATLFRPSLAGGKNARALAHNRTAKRVWEKSMPEFEKAKLVAHDNGEQMWRISIRMAAMNELDYGDFVSIVNLKVQDQLSQLKAQKGVSALLTGSIPMMYKAQHQVLRDLLQSFLTAFVLISLVLIFVLRSIPAGLVAMVPNVFPPIVVFGAMGWLGWSIEIGSVMTASVALGIAVDDTIHFLTWYRRGMSNGLRRYGAIRFAFEHCSKAMIDTTLICGLGVACFMFSVFMPTVRFSRLLLVLLSVALIGDLLLLPAILAGPLGKLFRGKKASVSETPDDELSRTVPPPTAKSSRNGENLTQSVQ